MFEFFLALFGSLHYGTKISSERAASKAYDKSSKARFTWHDERLRKWQEQVIDRALEEDLKNFIADPCNYDKVWEEVQSAYQQIPFYKHYTKVLLHEHMVEVYFGKGQYTKKQRENIVAAYREDALDIMLSKRGKVRGPQVSSLDKILIVNKGDGERSRSLWDRDYDFVLFLRNALRKNGVNARAIFLSGLFGSEHESQAYDIENIEKFHYMAGRFVWLPLTFFDDDLHYVSVC